VHDALPLTPAVLGREAAGYKEFGCMAPLHGCCVGKTLALVTLRGVDVMNSFRQNNRGPHYQSPDFGEHQAHVFTVFHGVPPCLLLAWNSCNRHAKSVSPVSAWKKRFGNGGRQRGSVELVKVSMAFRHQGSVSQGIL
jgi:hypothetical protein